MNSINSHFSTSFFRNSAAAFSAPSKKAVAGNEGRNEGFKGSISTIRDKFTLSHEGRLVYEKHFGKSNKTAGCVSVTQTQIAESKHDIGKINKTDKSSQTAPTAQTQTAEVVNAPRIFSTAPESVDNLIQFLGLDTINANEATLAGALNLSLEAEAKIIAAEGGLENYEKTEYYQSSELSSEQSQHLRNLIVNFRPFEIKQRAYSEHSEHLDKISSALGLDPNNKLQPDTKNFYAHARDNIRILHAQSQANREKIDEKIAHILKSNNIVLDKNEILNLKVNQRGEITVDDGLNADKRAKVEKIVNEDKSLARDLLFTHAERKTAMGEGGSASQYILIDSLLQREYGVSLNDFKLSKFERTTLSPSWDRHMIVPKDSDHDVLLHGNHELLDKLYNEDLQFYNEIEHALNFMEKHEGDYEVSFSYKNGITIEEGTTDQAALNKVAERLMSYPFSCFFDVEASITIDASGIVQSTQVFEVGRFWGTNTVDVAKRLKEFFGAVERNDYHVFSSTSPTQSRLQQYAFDAQRLFQFNTGVDAATAKAMNVTFGNAE